MIRRRRELGLGEALATATALIRMAIATDSLERLSRNLKVAIDHIDGTCARAAVGDSFLRRLPQHKAFAAAVAAADVAVAGHLARVRGKPLPLWSAQ